MDKKTYDRLIWKKFLIIEIAKMLIILPIIFLSATIFDKILLQSTHFVQPFSSSAFLCYNIIAMLIGIFHAIYSELKYREIFKYPGDSLSAGIIAGMMMFASVFLTLALYNFVTWKIMSGIYASVFAIIIWVGATFILAKEFELNNQEINSAKEKFDKPSL